MLTSIVMPTYNKSKRLELTLLTLTKQEYDFNRFELIVVDDGSSDNTRNVVSEFIKKQIFDIKYIYQENRGRAAARNAGIKQAEGEVIIFLDDDRLVYPDFIYQHTRFFEEQTGSDIAVLGRRMNLYISRIDEEFEKIKKQVEADCTQLFKKAREDYYWRKTRVVFQMPSIGWSIFTTGNASIAAKTLKDTYLFNESFQGWGFEDIELGYRLWKNSISFVSNEKAVNYHMEHTRNPEKLEEETERNIELFYRLHPELTIFLYSKYIKGEISLEELNEKVSGETYPYGIKSQTYYKKKNFLI